MSIKEDVHHLIDELPDKKLMIARRYLESLIADENDSLLTALMQSPVDDEPSTPEEDASDEEGWQEYLRGETRDWDDIQSDLPR